MLMGLKTSLTAVGVAIAALALAACGAGEGSNSTTSPSGSSASASSPTAAAVAFIDPLKAPIKWPDPTKLTKAVNVKGKTIWWIPIGDSISEIHAQGEGFRQAVESAGGTVKLCDGTFNPADIGNCLGQAASQGAGAVVTDYIDYAAVPTSFDALEKANVPVLIAGAVRPKGVSDTALRTFYDDSPTTILMNQAVAAGALIAGGDKPNGLAIVLTDSDNTRAATEQLVVTWKKLCPGCPSASIEFSTANLDKLSSSVSAALVSNPDINVVMVPNDAFTGPVSQALKTAGKPDAKIVSSGADLANMQNVKAGSQAGDAGAAGIHAGWAITNALFQLLVGDTVAPNNPLVRYFDSSNIGNLTLTPEAYLSNAWYGDDSYQPAFKTAWGIS